MMISPQTGWVSQALQVVVKITTSPPKEMHGGNIGVSLVGYLVHLPRVPQVCPVKEAQVEKDHSP